jgi:hypothetical protein
VTLTGAAVANTAAVSHEFDADDRISIYFTTTGATASDDIVLTTIFQRYV